MELRHLRYFIAVAEEENVTRAAARLHISQPPLSRQIQDLEDELGIALFERTGKAVKLTDAGRVFLIEAQVVLQRVDEAVRSVRAVATGKRGELHLGYAPSPTVCILPPALRLFQEKAPGIRVMLHDQSSPEMLAGLRDGTLHAALMVQPAPEAMRGIVFEKLREFPIVLAVPPGHRLSRKRSVSVQEALREPIVAYSHKEYPDYHEMLGRIIGPKIRHLQFAEECDSGMSLITAVASGKGVAFNMSSLEDTGGRRLHYLPLKPAPAPAVVGIAYSKNKLSPMAKSFLETIRSTAIEAD